MLARADTRERAAGALQALPRLLGADGLVRQIGQVWLGATLANVLLYVFHVLAGRGLGPEDYGLFGALFGIVYLAGAASNAIQVSIARYVATGRARDRTSVPDMLVTSMLLQMLVVGGSIFIALSFASPFMDSYLKIGGRAPIILLGAILAVALLMPVTQGALLGGERFGWYAAALIVNAGGRVLAGLIALSLHLGVVGLLGAVGLASVLATCVGLAVTRPPLRAATLAPSVRPSTAELLPALLGFLVVSLPTSADVVIVRHFFAPQDAGLYAGTAVLGRIVLFLPISISLVLFPKTSQGAALGRPTRALLRKGLILTACLSGSVTLFFVLAPDTTISLVLGGEYADAGSIVPIYAAAMFLFSLGVVFFYYHLAVGRAAFFYFLLLPHVALELSLLYVLHQSLAQVATVLLAMNASLVLTSYAYTRLTQDGTGGGRQPIDGPWQDSQEIADDMEERREQVA